MIQMALSAAIRRGSKLRPQGRLALLYNGATCALGAAGEAIGIKLYDESYRYPPEAGEGGYEQIHVAFPILNKLYTKCHLCGRHLNMIPHLNDDHFWTREQIADYVEGVELSLELAIEQPAAATVNAATVNEEILEEALV
jgi:hypothetical protein